MSTIRNLLGVLLCSTLLLNACKGDAKEKTIGMVDQVQEVVEQVDQLDHLHDKEEFTDTVKSIIAPSTEESKEKQINDLEAKAKPTNNHNTDIGSEKKMPTEISKNNVKEIEEEEVNESFPEANPSNTIPKQKPNVLKDIEKPIEQSNTNEEKVKIQNISKPNKQGAEVLKIDQTQAQFSHASFHSILKNYVSANGAVNYPQLRNAADELNAYCKLLEDNGPNANWSRNDKLAYWLNAYNAFTLKLIIDNYPIGSITELDSGKPWDRKWIKLDGKDLSLNNIENDIIRPTFKDARIHFAVNCAAKSCPPLGNFAFTGRNVDSKLEALTKSFINGPANEISEEEIKVSKIFDWYREDFGDLVEFINRYSLTKVNANAKVRFMEYDWALNEK